jgi:hypothetical protein
MYKAKLADIERNSEELEDDFYLYKKVPEDVYIRLRTKLAKEKAEILKILSTIDVESSNLKTYFREGITLSTQLATSWTSSPIPVKEKLQKFVFPEGVTYNREKRVFLTSKVNSLFGISEGDKNKQGSISCSDPTGQGSRNGSLNRGPFFILYNFTGTLCFSVFGYWHSNSWYHLFYLPVTFL